ncbi:unnamed protein product, partial [Symbiodinium necroappetens]
MWSMVRMTRMMISRSTSKSMRKMRRERQGLACLARPRASSRRYPKCRTLTRRVKVRVRRVAEDLQWSSPRVSRTYSGSSTASRSSPIRFYLNHPRCTTCSRSWKNTFQRCPKAQTRR